MAELKTKETGASVDLFLNKLKEEDVRRDCFELCRLMKHATGSDPKMWGSSIIGFGNRRLKYPNGRELDWMLMGFSPRKANITLYLAGGLEPQSALLKKLGKYSTGKGCLHIKKLKDVDTKVLKHMISQSARSVTESGS